jgi:hypothetical protein
VFFNSLEDWGDICANVNVDRKRMVNREYFIFFNINFIIKKLMSQLIFLSLLFLRNK